MQLTHKGRYVMQYRFNSLHRLELFNALFQGQFCCLTKWFLQL